MKTDNLKKRIKLYNKYELTTNDKLIPIINDIIEVLDSPVSLTGEDIQKLKGDKGDDGINGTDGVDGTDGEDGKDGVNGRDGKTGRDGKDGVGLDGVDGRDGSPDTATDIRDKLESLEGDERLDVSSIKGLEKELTKKQSSSSPGFRGFPKINFVDSETPMGVINDINTIFTLKNTPLDGSLKLYHNGLRLTVIIDYTLQKNTITFLDSPFNGDILIADYRY